MGKNVAIGGQRLGSGNKMNVSMHDYGRSTHDLGRIFRSTIAPGTLVPFFTEIGLNGDTFDIDLESLVRTAPTTGPLFGSFKMQVDMFSVPMRLYNANLHMNLLGVGMDMSKILFPIMNVEAYNPRVTTVSNPKNIFGRFDQSSIMAYLGIRGGMPNIEGDDITIMRRNGLMLLAYWDIFKQYYANKQEEKAYYIKPKVSGENVVSQIITNRSGMVTINTTTGIPSSAIELYNWSSVIFSSTGGGLINDADISFEGWVNDDFSMPSRIYNLRDIINNKDEIATNNELRVVKTDTGYELFNDREQLGGEYIFNVFKLVKIFQKNSTSISENEVEIGSFDLNVIDDTRKSILKWEEATPYEVGWVESDWINPYRSCYGSTTITNGAVEQVIPNNNSSQNGLALKTYQSDLFNNWIQTDWIDGENGISAVTAIDTTGDSFTLDTLNLSKKVYDMLNRIAVSGGSYQDWQGAVYGTNTMRMSESPVYHGGMSREITFEEVVSTADTTTAESGHQPMGTLAGKGSQGRSKKGGQVRIKVSEPSIIMGIVSITPRIDYAQGNKWFTRLETMDDLHKPALDGIGWQPLITEQMAYWDGMVTGSENNSVEYKSAGKQPSWLNYMTAYNEVYGSFAHENELMFMTLTRRYEYDKVSGIKDLTTYIDPTKYNYAFANSRLDAQNFWVQIATDVKARRIISAKQIPNL